MIEVSGHNRRFGYSRMRVLAVDVYGTPMVEVSYRRWHPGYWLHRLRYIVHPPQMITCALGETCELSA